MENMDVNPEADMASKKPSKVKAVFAAVIAVVLVLGGVYYFVFGQDQAVPPSLGPGSGTLQGLIQTGKYDFLTFSQDEIDAWVEPTGDYIDLTVDGNNLGLFTILTNKETTGGDLIASLDHSLTGDFMIAAYDNATSYTSEDLSEYHNQAWITSEQDFYSAVGGLLTKLDENQLNNLKIPAYKAIVLYTNKNTKVYGDWSLAGEEVEGYYDFCSGSAGWTNAVSSSDLKAAFKECVPDEVFQLVESGQNEGVKYEEVTKFMDVTNLPGNNTIWAYYEDAPGTNKLKETQAVTGCDKYSDPDEYVAALQTAVADLDLAAVYCLQDEETKDAVDILIDSVRETATDLRIDDSAEALKEMVPKFLEISDNVTAMGQLLQFFEVGTADVLYDEYVQTGKKVITEIVLEASDVLLPEIKDLVALEGDNLAFLERASVMLGKVREEAAKISLLQGFSSGLTEYLELIRHAEVTITEISPGLVMAVDVMSSLDDKGIANVVVALNPIAPYDTIGGIPKGAFGFDLKIIKDEEGNLTGSLIYLQAYEIESVDEFGVVTKHKGIEEIFGYYAEKIKGISDKEGEKFQLLPEFLGETVPFVEDYASTGDIANIIGVLKVFIEYAVETGGNVTLIELTETADLNGLQFTSNQYSQWLGGFYEGEPYELNNEIFYQAGVGSEGKIDFYSYIVGGGTADENITFMDLFGDTALTVKLWTIDIEAVQTFTEAEVATFNFFTRPVLATDAESAVIDIDAEKASADEMPNDTNL
ncbi:MAG: hypothetical protein ABID64_00605 [Nitrospirota bacterium]